MNLSQLRAFDAVAREGSFTRAAERLNVSQPAVTNHIKMLEEAYELALFHRSGRGVALTEVGEKLLVLSRQVFALEEQAADLLSATRTLKRGRLRLGAGSPYFIVPVLAKFREKFPGVHLDLTLGNTAQVTAALLAEQVDLAMLTDWSVEAGREDNPQLEAIPFARHPVIVFCSRHHPWALKGRQSVGLAELAAEPMIWREPGSITRQVFERACGQAGVSIAPVMEVASRETVLEAVAAGLGLGYVSARELPDDPRVHPLRLEGVDVTTTEYILLLKRRKDLRIVREFLKVALG